MLIWSHLSLLAVSEELPPVLRSLRAPAGVIGKAMIESILYFGSGFLAAAIVVVAVVPIVHGRAVRLAERRFAAKMGLDGNDEPTAS